MCSNLDQGLMLYFFQWDSNMLWIGAGDKPELIYPEAKQELRDLGYESTLEYVAGKSLVNFSFNTLFTYSLPDPNITGQKSLLQIQASDTV